MGEFGLIAAQIQPGPHLKKYNLPGNLPWEKFDYFHEAIAHKEICRLGAPGFVDGMKAGLVIGLPPVMYWSKKSIRERVVDEVMTGKK